MKRVLVIDDMRKMRFLNKEARGGVINLVYAETTADGLREIQKYDSFDEVWFDHDMGGADTTRPIALLLEALNHIGKAPTINTVYVHTDNPAGGDYLMAALKNVYEDVRRTRIEPHELGTGV